jgi:transposase
MFIAINIPLEYGRFLCRRINHSKEFAVRRNHINTVKNFGNQAKRRLRKFNCLVKEFFNLFLQERMRRFNYPSQKLRLQVLKKWIKTCHKELELKNKK